MLSGNLKIEEYKALIYTDPHNSAGPIEEKDFHQLMSRLKAELRNSGLPLTTLADLAVSNMHYTVEGDDSLGYKITAKVLAQLVMTSMSSATARATKLLASPWPIRLHRGPVFSGAA